MNSAPCRYSATPHFHQQVYFLLFRYARHGADDFGHALKDLLRLGHACSCKDANLVAAHDVRAADGFPEIFVAMLEAQLFDLDALESGG
jgi:hypothetical protein